MGHRHRAAAPPRPPPVRRRVVGRPSPVSLFVPPVPCATGRSAVAGWTTTTPRHDDTKRRSRTLRPRALRSRVPGPRRGTFATQDEGPDRRAWACSDTAVLSFAVVSAPAGIEGHRNCERRGAENGSCCVGGATGVLCGVLSDSPWGHGRPAGNVGEGHAASQARRVGVERSGLRALVLAGRFSPPRPRQRRGGPRCSHPVVPLRRLCASAPLRLKSDGIARDTTSHPRRDKRSAVRSRVAPW